MDNCVSKHLSQIEVLAPRGPEHAWLGSMAVPFLFTTAKPSDGVAGTLLCFLAKLAFFSPSFHVISMVFVALQADGVLHCSHVVLASPSLASIGLISVVLLLFIVIPMLRETCLLHTYGKAHMRVVQMVLATEQARPQRSSQDAKPKDEPEGLLVTPLLDPEPTLTPGLLNQDCVGAKQCPDLLADVEKVLPSEAEPLPPLCNEDGTLKHIAAICPPLNPCSSHSDHYDWRHYDRSKFPREYTRGRIYSPLLDERHHWVRAWRSCGNIKRSKGQSWKDAPRVDSLEHVASVCCMGPWNSLIATNDNQPLLIEYGPTAIVGLLLTVLGPGAITALLILQYSGYEVTWYSITSPILVACSVFLVQLSKELLKATNTEFQYRIGQNVTFCNAIATTVRKRIAELLCVATVLAIMLFVLIAASHVEGYIHGAFWPCFVPLWLPLLALLLLTLSAFPKDQSCVAKLMWVACALGVVMFIGAVVLFPLIVDGLVPVPFTAVVAAFAALPAGVVFFFVFVYI